MKSWQKTLTLVLSAALATSLALFAASCGGGNDPTTDVTYTVTYAFGSCEDEPYAGPSTLPTETDKAAGAKFNVAAAPDWEGYTFKGWNDGTATYLAGAEYTMPAKAVTLTGTWEVTPVVDTDEGTGTKDDPFILSSLEGILSADLPACAESNEFVYYQFTATESAIFQTSYSDNNDLGFMLTENGAAAGSNAVAIWSLKSESYAFPIEQGKTYTLRLCGNEDTAVKVDITFTKVPLTIPADDYNGTWADKEENPTYTLVVENNTVTVNGTAVTELALVKFNGGFTFKWNDQNCSMTVPKEEKTSLICSFGDVEVTLYQAGNFPTPPAVGSEENPEVIEQSTFAKAYSVELPEGEYYYTITPTTTKVYKVSTDIDYLQFTMTDEDGESIVNLDSSKAFEVVFELEANKTYSIFVTDGSNETGMDYQDVSFEIEESEFYSKEVPAALVGTWKDTNGKASITFTENTFTTDFSGVLDYMPHTVIEGNFSNVAASSTSATYEIIAVAHVTGIEYSIVYDLATHTITFPNPNNANVSYTLAKEGETSDIADLDDAWKFLWQSERPEEDDGSAWYVLDLSGDYAVFCETGIYYMISDITYTAEENTLVLSVPGFYFDEEYTFVLNGETLTLTYDEVDYTLNKAAVVDLPEGLEGTYTATIEGMGGLVTLTISSMAVELVMGEDDSATTMSGVVTGYDKATNTLTFSVNFSGDSAPVELVYDAANGTLSGEAFGLEEPVTFTKGESYPWPSALTGDWLGSVDFNGNSIELALSLGKEITLSYGGGEPSVGTFVSWDADSKTLTISTGGYTYDFVWDETENTLTCDDEGDIFVCHKQGG